MMSTFSGLVLGVVSAALVTVWYGDQLSQQLRDWLDGAPRPVSQLTQETGKGSGVPAPAVAVDAGAEATDRKVVDDDDSSVAATVHQPAAPSKGVQEGAVEALQQRWASYSEQAAVLSATGDFPHRACFRRAAAAHQVPETLLLAVASGESNFDSAARSHKDAIGLMQIQWPGTSHHLGVRREADLYDPCTNVDAGARYIVELSRRYDGDLHRVLGAYNYGPGRINAGPMPEGARWYSQYIYQHLQQVLGQPHVASSELLAARTAAAGGYDVLMTFNRAYRAREFVEFLRLQAPGVELAQRSERLGRHEVVLLYQSPAERATGRRLLANTGLLALMNDDNAVNSL